MVIIINPGSGPVAGASQENAAAAMVQFAADVRAQHNLREVGFRPNETCADLGDGRYAFVLTAVTADGREYVLDIDMPGLPVEKVRYTGADGQDIWDFPRLYVEGDSWVWKFAVDAAGPPDPEDDEPGAVPA